MRTHKIDQHLFVPHCQTVFLNIFLDNKTIQCTYYCLEVHYAGSGSKMGQQPWFKDSLVDLKLKGWNII